MSFERFVNRTCEHLMCFLERLHENVLEITGKGKPFLRPKIVSQNSTAVQIGQFSSTMVQCTSFQVQSSKFSGLINPRYKVFWLSEIYDIIRRRESLDGPPEGRNPNIKTYSYNNCEN